jgi:hypothetical protein
MQKWQSSLWEELARNLNAELEARGKWNIERVSLKVGELVMVMDLPVKSAGLWPVGRVVAL